MRYLILLLALIIPGCNFIDAIPAHSPDKQDKQEQKDSSVSEAEVWKELALSIEKGVHRDTDDVVFTAENLKTMGRLSDISRIEPLRKKLVRIDETNRAEIAAGILK